MSIRAITKEVSVRAFRYAVYLLIALSMWLSMPGCVSQKTQTEFAVHDERATAVLVAQYADDLTLLMEIVDALLEYERTMMIGDIRRSLLLMDFITISGEANTEAFASALADPAVQHPLLDMVRDGVWSRTQAEQWLTDYSALRGFSDAASIRNRMITQLSPIVRYDAHAERVRGSFDSHAAAVESVAREVLASRATVREYAESRGLSAGSLAVGIDALAEGVVWPSIRDPAKREAARDLWRELLESFGPGQVE